MPLSEHEQRQLEKIEQALYREDPGLGARARRQEKSWQARVRKVRRVGRPGEKFRLALLPALMVIILSVGATMLAVVGYSEAGTPADMPTHVPGQAMTAAILWSLLGSCLVAVFWVAWMCWPNLRPPKKH